jgi:hypothetical protein
MWYFHERRLALPRTGALQRRRERLSHEFAQELASCQYFSRRLPTGKPSKALSRLESAITDA